MKRIYKGLWSLLVLLGCFLTYVNIYGVFVDVRPSNIINENLRFPNDLTLTYDESLEQVRPLINEKPLEYSIRLTQVISKSLAHIEWYTETNTRKYNQLIPIWENYLLYFMGIFSGIPEFQKYHYSDYKRSLKRGIGVCGDASMVMSQLLDKQGIPNQIITFPGHVILSAEIGNEKWIFDPDFGVVLPFNPEEINKSPAQIYQHYKNMGYSTREINQLMDGYGQKFKSWDGVSHFMTKKYYFEKFAYFVKWPLPIALIIVGVVFIRRQK